MVEENSHIEEEEEEEPEERPEAQTSPGKFDDKQPWNGESQRKELLGVLIRSTFKREEAEGTGEPSGVARSTRSTTSESGPESRVRR